MDGASVEPGGDASVVFELVEAPFDRVADLVSFEIVGDRTFAGRVARDDRLGMHPGDQRPQRIGIISLIRQHALRSQAFQQIGCDWGIAALSRCQDDAQRTAKRIGGEMDLCRQPASGAPQSLIPPFEPLPVAACWCALTRLLSSET